MNTKSEVLAYSDMDDRQINREITRRRGYTDLCWSVEDGQTWQVMIQTPEGRCYASADYPANTFTKEEAIDAAWNAQTPNFAGDLNAAWPLLIELARQHPDTIVSIKRWGYQSQDAARAISEAWLSANEEAETEKVV